MNFVKYAVLGALFQIWSLPCMAQVFGEEQTASSLSSKITETSIPSAATETQKNYDSAPTPTEEGSATAPNNPLPSTNILNLNQPENSDNNFQGIYIYYNKFKVSHLFNGMTRCILNFVVYTTLPQKLSNISVRLKWPETATQLSFDSVMPGKEYSVSQSFYGKGCYSMDKLPNITVNRCRIKGMEQRTCAALVRLTTEDQAPHRQ